MKGDSVYTPEVTAQVENKSLPTAQHCSSQLVKYLLAQIIKFKAADCCQAALYTYVLKITQYHAVLCFISLPQFEQHILPGSHVPLCLQRDLTA